MRFKKLKWEEMTIEEKVSNLKNRIWKFFKDYPEIKNLIFTSQKNKYAISNNKPNILIDDMSSNIKMWEEKGGIGIHYRAEKHDLENYLFAEIEKYYENI